MNQDNIRIKSGIDLISAIHDLTLACIENNVFLLPNEILNLQKTHKIGCNFDTKKYLTKYGYNNEITSNNDEINATNNKVDIYKNYLLQTGITFEDLVSKCFKINKEDFYIKLNKTSFEIKINDCCKDDFLIKNAQKISKNIRKINNKFKQNRIIAIKKRDNLLLRVDKIPKMQFPEVKKGDFII